MSPLLSRVILVGLLGSSAMGCRHSLTYTRHDHGYHQHHREGIATLGVVTGLLVGAAVVEAAQAQKEDEERPYYYYSNGYYGPPPVMARSTRDRVEPDVELPPFDPHAARAALNDVDVSTCNESGAPRGYGHAKVTFNPDGRISKVVVDAPDKMTDGAAKCIGDAIGTATVAPFKGSLVTVGTTFHVR